MPMSRAAILRFPAKNRHTAYCLWERKNALVFPIENKISAIMQQNHIKPLNNNQWAIVFKLEGKVNSIQESFIQKVNELRL